ncbi:hypothetical protein NDU88_007742 [Pleurodeles waltl]|uniref:Uncharacterized protein n=1 Tax=Pleurodeles waltl TaxID=8319 RepID=A0AAV7ST68_PLEWA|nr:hypothetical protein NDU88_007742 [Pleurodeles waltl]
MCAKLAAGRRRRKYWCELRGETQFHKERRKTCVARLAPRAQEGLQPEGGRKQRVRRRARAVWGLLSVGSAFARY